MYLLLLATDSIMFAAMLSGAWIEIVTYSKSHMGHIETHIYHKTKAENHLLHRLKRLGWWVKNNKYPFLFLNIVPSLPPFMLILQ